MGIECAIIPTAVLSTHTGGFKGYTFRDLSEDIEPVASHWKQEGLAFDGVSTGYLGSPDQAACIERVIDQLKPGLVFIDPVMADNGKLYAGFTEEIVESMRKLTSLADIVVPNLTEAAFLLGDEYRAPLTYDEAYIKDVLVRLTGLGAKKAALTGVMYQEDRQGVVAYDSETGEFCQYFSENLPIQCHGTGDVYSSTMFGAMLLEKPMEEAIRIAVDYTVACIRRTIGDKNHWYGVKFEECIPDLVQML